MSANVIPSGRELTRTPPMSQVKKKLSFSSEAVPRSGLTAIHGGTGRHRDVHTDTDTDIDTKVGDRLLSDQNAPFDFNTPERAHGVLEPQGSEFRRSRIGSTTTVSSKDPIAMLRGMEGYQLTQTDQDFIERMNQEKVLKRLEVELADLERSINREAMDLDLSLASEEKALNELKKLPSCEEIVDLAKPFLSQTTPISELDVLEQRTLLAMVEEPKVLLVVSQKKKALAAMEDRVRKKEAEEKEKKEKCILERKHEIKGLMIQLANLQSDLAKETETCTALEVMAAAHPAVLGRVPISYLRGAPRGRGPPVEDLCSKPKSRKFDSEPTAVQPAAAAKKTRKATSAKETTAPEQADSLRRSKRIASKNSKK